MLNIALNTPLLIISNVKANPINIKRGSFSLLFMGRISTKKVKRIGNDLLENYGDDFTTDFDKNKVAVEAVLSVPSKKLRNTIVGYVTRRKKKAYKSRSASN